MLRDLFVIEATHLTGGELGEAQRGEGGRRATSDLVLLSLLLLLLSKRLPVAARVAT